MAFFNRKNTPQTESAKYNKPHCIIPIDDLQWVMKQIKSVQILWDECWASDPFGSRWIQLKTGLSERAFRLARKILYTAGLFQFKRDICIDDARKTAGWLVINLHGARRIADFWKKEEPEEQQEPIGGKFSPPIGTNEPDNGENLPDIDTLEPTISTENLEISSLPDDDSNCTETSQEPLKEVPVEEPKTDELFERVRGLCGEKTAKKIVNVLERCKKLAKGERRTDEEFLTQLFDNKYNWRIDTQRLKQLLNLNTEDRTEFFSRFNYLYQNKGMSASKTFDEAINSVKKHAEDITTMTIGKIDLINALT
ncbi:hypothetical protein NIES4106_10330 [Fischerella sp. NIES-4106]|nr:hypothetical protein NIES4106_10330 [Fischerella sp. NIES-4106]